MQSPEQIQLTEANPQLNELAAVRERQSRIAARVGELTRRGLQQEASEAGVVSLEGARKAKQHAIEVAMVESENQGDIPVHIAAHE